GDRVFPGDVASKLANADVDDVVGNDPDVAVQGANKTATVINLARRLASQARQHDAVDGVQVTLVDQVVCLDRHIGAGEHQGIGVVGDGRTVDGERLLGGDAAAVHYAIGIERERVGAGQDAAIVQCARGSQCCIAGQFPVGGL